ncbi:MAG: hypothetical protein ACREIF_08420 [Chthoniobacterales bacterium]
MGKPRLTLSFGVCLLLAIVWSSHRLYQHWEERSLMRQAHLACDRNALRWAAMATERAFAVDSSSLDACRTLAAINERQKNLKALDWRRRALALQPDSLGDRLALAESALSFGEPAVAAEMLRQVPAAQQNDARFQLAAAHFALVKNDFAAAEKHFRAAVQLAPNDSGKQLELAEFQLRSDDGAKRREGRRIAESLQSDPKFRLAALHVLLNDAIRRGQEAASLDLIHELATLPEAPFAGRLPALDLLHRLNDPDLRGALARLETEAIPSAEKAVALINWMSSHGQPKFAID